MMGLFGKKEERDPKGMVREWNTKLRQEGRQLDRQIRGIQREELKAQKSLKDAAKKGQKDVCVILAKEIVRSRKAVSKIHCAKAQLKSVEYSLTQQLAQIRIAGALQKSTEVMKSMQTLIKVPEVMKTMRELSQEMSRAGIIEEMLEDTMDMEADDELEGEAQEEVEKVLFELTEGVIGTAPKAVTDTLPTPEPEQEEAAALADDEDVSDMQARLEALRS